jgi:hypothetical protein
LFSRTLTFPPISWPSRYSQELYSVYHRLVVLYPILHVPRWEKLACR